MSFAAIGALRGYSRRWRLRDRGIAVGYFIVALGFFFLVNWVYQVSRKPVELLAPASESFYKSPEQTWKTYGELFVKYSTADISPELLAAIAQVEAEGNPIARTYWRWQWSWNPFEIYRPASSSVGMYQMTDGTFAVARNYCVKEHKVFSGMACRFTSLYNRALPSHAIELTAAYLQQIVQKAIAAKAAVAKTTVNQRQKLAAAVHLCGAGKAESFIRRAFHPGSGEKCGEQSLRNYLKRVEQARARFIKLRAKLG
ncbi:MAG TPA: transglycosylase SLT domain-containing protein [Candidatus Binatia bacterium]|jgi:hypothetical protein